MIRLLLEQAILYGKMDQLPCRKSENNLIALHGKPST